MKEQQFTQLLIKMSKCNNCLDMKKKNGSDCSLINIYKNQDLCKNIPSIWTDWYNRLNSDIMIIGQDWGPYQDMEKFYNMYRSNPTKDNWNDIINQE